MSNSHNRARRQTTASVHNRYRESGVPKMCLLVAMCIGAISYPMAGRGSQPVPDGGAVDRPTLTDAQSHFYNARYEAAAASALARRESGTDDLAGDELRTSALLFQLKALLEGHSNPEEALTRCAACP